MRSDTIKRHDRIQIIVPPEDLLKEAELKVVNCGHAIRGGDEAIGDR
jgi:hypothetical protein